MNLHTRFMIRRDIESFMEIERLCFRYPWDEATFNDHVRQMNCAPMVTELDGNVVGYYIYELYKRHFEITNFAVHPDYWRRGIGTEMTRKLKLKLSPIRRTKIEIVCDEFNTNAHLFWRAMGFTAEVLRDFYEAADAYRFEYRLPVEVYV